MIDDSLIQALPELVAFVRRDGTVVRELGGRRLGLTLDGDLAGRTLNDLWPQDVAALLLQMIRRALRDRGTSDAQFCSGGRQYEARIAAHGRDRALCIIRDAPAPEHSNSHEDVRGGHRGGIERRELFARLSQSVADARLRERQLAVCLVHLQGMGELGGILDYGIVDQLAGTELQRISTVLADGPIGYAGRLAENELLVVVERFDDRGAIRDLANGLLKRVAEPVAVGDATFTMTPSAGLALLGDDGSDARQLLESARSAMLEARRSGPNSVHFYSDDLQVRSLARLDIEHELRDAIAQDQLALRYAARHCLESGQLIAVHAYLRWPHPARGEVAAAEFLPIAESTGLATPLSRWALARFQRDMPSLRPAGVDRIRFSFGALRSHLSSGGLKSDVEALFDSGAVTPADFELRISERVLAGLADPGPTLRPLVDLGVAVAIDEFGRGFTSLPRLARLPISVLQLDRRLALAAAADPVARRAATAALAVARALELIPMSAGIDDESQRVLLQSLGCTQGLGDAFGAVSLHGSERLARRRRNTR
ncbi:MAG: EAL domain-containing protein [Steroidobacteraceae bacterium]